MFADKVKEALDRLGKNPLWLSSKTGFSDAHVYNVLNGIRRPTPKVVAKFSEALGFDASQMQSWVEADRLGEDGVAKAAQALGVSEAPRGAMRISSVAMPRLAVLTLAGTVGCGRKIELHADETITLPEDVAQHGDYAVYAQGDSMNRLGITDGDVLIVRSTRRAEDGQVVVANIKHDGSTCKRFKRFGKIAMLVPESFAGGHEPIAVTEDVAILGVVTYIHRPGIPLE